MSGNALPAGGRLLFGRHPSLWLGTLAAVLSLGTALGLPGLSGPQVAALNTGVTAVVAAVWAWQVRPIAPAVFTGAAAAIAGVAAAYGFEVPSETVGAVQALIVQTLTLIAWGQVSPAALPAAGALDRATPEQAALGGQQMAPGAHRPDRTARRQATPPPGTARY